MLSDRPDHPPAPATRGGRSHRFSARQRAVAAGGAAALLVGVAVLWVP